MVYKKVLGSETNKKLGAGYRNQDDLEPKSRILIVEDDRLTAEFLIALLENAGYDVTHVVFKDDAAIQLKRTFDLVVLDLLLPDSDGLEVLQLIRARGTTIPILILTGLSAMENKLAGLSDGADDYMTKPFDHRELLLRIQVLIRRSGERKMSHLELDGLVLDDALHCAFYHDRKLPFTHKEYLIVRALIENRGASLTKKQLLEVVYPDAEKRPKLKIIDVYIFKIRAKLAEATDKNMQIRTVWGVGIKLDIMIPGSKSEKGFDSTLKQ